MLLKKLTTFLVLLFTISSVFGLCADNTPLRKIHGKVLDAEGSPVVGAGIVVLGKPELGGAITDLNGSFRFDAPSAGILEISCLGFETSEVRLTEKKDYRIILYEYASVIDEAVVVGYGVQTKESVVGAISQVNAEDLEDAGTNQLGEALAGKVAGLYTYTSSYAPGEETPTILIRGLSSWNGDEPLVMVDGVEREMDSVAPEEVASISILKDASATAVYGAKGANGVILVTTKTGSKGRPTFHVKVQESIESPLRLWEHVDAPTVINLANVAYRNGQSFGSIYSDKVIKAYADQSDPLRYPDVNWQELMFKPCCFCTNASLRLSGGSDRARYFLSVSYANRESILKDINELGKTNYASDKINYRLNLDFDITKSTVLSVKFGGITSFNRYVRSIDSSSELINTMYMASTVTYPAYFPEWALEKYPDLNYPDESGIRYADNQSCKVVNPYSVMAAPDYTKKMNNRLMLDLILRQELNFITPGLSVDAKFSLTTRFDRIAETVAQGIPKWDISWDLYDASPDNNPWVPDTNSAYVYKENPFAITQDNAASGVNYVTYFEGSVRYKRMFDRKHNVSGLVLYNQRQYNSKANFPRKNQSFVARATYDYKGKYLFETNLGITGSEQFAPSNRYGVFPSVAAGYFLSKEDFWRSNMWWWSKFKIRYSNGLVGSDKASSTWLYYSEWSRNGLGYITEDKLANETASWETAHKQDLGIEMGWLKNKLQMTVELYDEKRKDMLLAPVVTPFVGVDSKDLNIGALKKHGFEVELTWADSFGPGIRYNVGAMIGMSENRITAYNDGMYTPEYQKVAGTPYMSQRKGDTLVDDRFFTSVDEIHGYPTYAGDWTHVYPGVYKFLDYVPDGTINSADLHVLEGSAYPLGNYSVRFGLRYKGLEFRVLGVGTIGKKIAFKRAAQMPLYSGDLVAHKASLDYWRPDNHDASAPTVSFSDQMYSWGGGTAVYPGYDLAIPDFTWRDSDYFTIKEVHAGYTFRGAKLKRAIGVKTLNISLTINNLWTFTGLVEGDPQRLTTATYYYPTMRVCRFNFGFIF